MPLQAQDGDEAVTFATVTLVEGSVVNTTTLPLYLRERDMVLTVQEAGWVVGVGLCPHLDSVLRL